jgi:tetratricopeptide (TPR) repeat protein
MGVERIGNVLDDMGKYEEALIEYQQALEVFLAIGMARSTRAWPPPSTMCWAERGSRRFERGGRSFLEC